MKKILVVLLMGLLLIPSEVYSRKYFRTRRAIVEMPTRIPIQDEINVYVDYETGDMLISSNNDIIGLNITITSNGVTYYNTTTSLCDGCIYTDCLDFLDVGEYVMTLSTVSGIISQYHITVTED